MSASNGVITAPVSISDVKGVLGSSSNDLGTLCKASTVNPWSVYGPCGVNMLFAEKADLLVPHWKTTTALDGNSAHTFMIYNPPAGGTDSPYRLADFNGYVHDTNSPQITVNCTAPSSESQRTFTVSLLFDYRTASNNVSLYDFTNVHTTGKYAPYAIITFGSNIIRLPLTTTNGYEYTGSTTVAYEQSTYTYVVGLAPARADGTVSNTIAADDIIRFTTGTSGSYTVASGSSGSDTVPSYVDLTSFDTYVLLNNISTNQDIQMTVTSSVTAVDTSSSKVNISISATNYGTTVYDIYCTVTKKNINTGAYTTVYPRTLMTEGFMFSSPHKSLAYTIPVAYESQNLLFTVEMQDSASA